MCKNIYEGANIQIEIRRLEASVVCKFTVPIAEQEER